MKNMYTTININYNIKNKIKYIFIYYSIIDKAKKNIKFNRLLIFEMSSKTQKFKFNGQSDI